MSGGCLSNICYYNNKIIHGLLRINEKLRAMEIFDEMVKRGFSADV